MKQLTKLFELGRYKAEVRSPSERFPDLGYSITIFEDDSPVHGLHRDSEEEAVATAKKTLSSWYEIGEAKPKTLTAMTLTSEQIKAMHGNGGYWCQGDAVHIQSNDELGAISQYRLKMSQGSIGITSNLETLDAYKAKVANVAKNLAYSERNKMLAAYCRLAFTSGLTVGIGQDDSESEEWRNIIFIDTPNGQVSFHIHSSELPLFSFLPPYTRKWDGHDTETKWQRLLGLAKGEFEVPNDFDGDDV
ncbi:hypothetical protein ACX27_27320 [Nostoc piscinale CENA21]|uniref:WDGH domain-containing protein n=1 Tax=Nostoc piscinale CENA21 TaxID=224013 RepID=A0A0M4SQ93_9NOSO|nr:hypothetical protein [Nostoc piscinale]ALF55722.1 hypothetical protein ACX27_27320 [Nostoc piscinale CENA21]